MKYSDVLLEFLSCRDTLASLSFTDPARHHVMDEMLKLMDKLDSFVLIK